MRRRRFVRARVQEPVWPVRMDSETSQPQQPVGQEPPGGPAHDGQPWWAMWLAATAAALGLMLAATALVLLLNLVFDPDDDGTAQAVEDLSAETERLADAGEALEAGLGKPAGADTPDGGTGDKALHGLVATAASDRLVDAYFDKLAVSAVAGYSDRIARLFAEDPQAAVDIAAGLGRAFVCDDYAALAGSDLTGADWAAEAAFRVGLILDRRGESAALWETFASEHDLGRAMEHLAALGCPRTLGGVWARANRESVTFAYTVESDGALSSE